MISFAVRTVTTGLEGYHIVAYQRARKEERRTL